MPGRRSISVFPGQEYRRCPGGRLPAGAVSGTGCGVYRYDSGGIILAEYLQGIVVAARGVPVTLIISLVAVLGGLVIGLLVAIA